MKDTFYFSHDYNARMDQKIKKLIQVKGMLGYGIFWAIVENLYNNANALPTDYDSIAFELRTKSDVIKSIINNFDLFIIEDGKFGSLSVERRLSDREEKSEKARQSAFKRWDKSEDNANAMRTHSEGNAIKERKVKESKEKKNIYTEDFNSFWSAYPKKVGKDDAFKSWQKKDKPAIADILAKLEVQKKTDQWQKDGGQFIPNPATYINQARWFDEIAAKPKHEVTW